MRTTSSTRAIARNATAVVTVVVSSTSRRLLWRAAHPGSTAAPAIPDTVITAIRDPATPGWPRSSRMVSSQVATALKTPTPTNSSAASRQSSGSCLSQAREPCSARLGGEGGAHAERDQHGSSGRHGHDRVAHQHQVQPALVEERAPGECGHEDADELPGARDRDRHGALAWREVAGRDLGAGVEHERLSDRQHQLTGQQPGVRRRVDDPQESAGRGEQRPGGQGRSEPSVHPSPGGDGQQHVHERVDHGQRADRAFRHPEVLAGLRGDRRERQPEDLAGGHERREGGQDEPAATTAQRVRPLPPGRRPGRTGPARRR